MMSKNSFLVSMKENNKRRLWLWIVSELLWFFYYPVGMAMLMSRKMEHNRIDGFVGAAAKLRLTEAAGEWLTSNNYVTAVLMAGMAIVCAIQGFSYLYSRKKVDMYHSVPVKKSRRFAVIFTDGVLIYLVPYLVNLLLAVLIAWISGGMDSMIAGQAAVCVLVNLVFSLGVYALSVLAVMMTGNLVITVFAVAVFLLYEPAVNLILEAYKMRFYAYYSYYSASGRLYLSPVWYFGEAMEAMAGTVSQLGSMLGAVLPYVLLGILLAAAFLGLAYFCYSKRPAEAAGKAMAFENTKFAVKFLLTVLFALGAALLVDRIVVSNVVFDISGAALAVVLSNCVIEVIYEADIKAAFRKKYQILVSGACVAVIAAVFAFDLTGFDAWIPSPEKLEDAVFIFTEEQGRTYMDENLIWMNVQDYALGKQGVKDIDAICELSSKKTEEKGDRIWLDVAYRMKNGKTVWRNFAVSTEEKELLDRVIGSEEYKKMTYQVYNDEEYDYIKKQEIKEIAFNNGFKIENLSPQDADMIRELWKKDMENMTYTTLRDEFKCGVIEVRLESEWKKRSYTVYDISYDIYPSFANLRGYLKEKGIDTENYLDVSDIESITVTNYHSEEFEKIYEENKETAGDAAAEISMSREDFLVTKTYTEEDKIKELAAAMYPRGLSRRWKLEGAVSDEYDVTVNYKNGKSTSSVYRGSPGAGLITDRIPGWLEAETAYK